MRKTDLLPTTPVHRFPQKWQFHWRVCLWMLHLCVEISIKLNVSVLDKADLKGKINNSKRKYCKGLLGIVCLFGWLVWGVLYVCLFVFFSFFLGQSDQHNSLVNEIHREQL